MSTHAAAQVFRKSFQAQLPRDARNAASAWLGDFTAHGPLDIRSIRLVEEPDAFVAVVTFSEMPAEDSPPRYFDNVVPMLRSA